MGLYIAYWLVHVYISIMTNIMLGTSCLVQPLTLKHCNAHDSQKPSQNPHNTKAEAKREYINKLVLCLAYMGSPTNGLRPYIITQHLGNNFHIWL